jgi:microcystin-dependent protein
MSTPYLAEIKMFGGNYAPRGFAMCNGQILPIAQNQALFALLGTTYGGNGQTTFALPDLRGRMPMHFGNGHVIGEQAGEAAHTLTMAEMAAHSDHALNASSSAATTGTPGNTVALATTTVSAYRAATNLTPMGAPLTNTGGNQAHENRQPYLGVTFIIALQGVFPSRN